jgi:hypothetical protein
MKKYSVDCTHFLGSLLCYEIIGREPSLNGRREGAEGTTFKKDRNIKISPEFRKGCTVDIK